MTQNHETDEPYGMISEFSFQSRLQGRLAAVGIKPVIFLNTSQLLSAATMLSVTPLCSSASVHNLPLITGVSNTWPAVRGCPIRPFG